MAIELKKEKTLVVIKPDGVARNLVGEVIRRFENVGLELVGLKMLHVDESMAFAHYGQTEEWFEKIGEKIRAFYEQNGFDPGEEFSRLSNRQMGELVQKWNVDYLTEGRVVAMVWKGFDAVKIVRKMVGATYPIDSIPGTIRGDFSTDSPLSSNADGRSVRNIIHASGTPSEAEKEIEMWFKEGEIF